MRFYAASPLGLRPDPGIELRSDGRQFQGCGYAVRIEAIPERTAVKGQFRPGPTAAQKVDVYVVAYDDNDHARPNSGPSSATVSL